MKTQRDAATEQACEQLTIIMQQSDPQNTLWVADENLDTHHLKQLLSSAQGKALPALLSNRFDIHTHAHALGYSSIFNDFDFSVYPSQSFDHIVFRIAKERAINQHVLTKIRGLLKQGGQLVLSGEKREGIRRYHDFCKEELGLTGNLKKQGTVYVGKLSSENTMRSLKARKSNEINKEDYSVLRVIDENFAKDDHRITVLSKPGLYGWDKVDQGSKLLVEALTELMPQVPTKAQTGLDLGCGYGYLSIALKQWVAQGIVATDNNAAAIIACKKNFERFGIQGKVIAGDTGSNIDERFDLVVCNPPFHQGFDINQALTGKFLQAAARLVSKNGMAVFVVNAFIGAEKAGEPFFKYQHIIKQTKQFKVLLFSQTNHQGS